MENNTEKNENNTEKNEFNTEIFLLNLYLYLQNINYRITPFLVLPTKLALKKKSQVSREYYYTKNSELVLFVCENVQNH